MAHAALRLRAVALLKTLSPPLRSHAFKIPSKHWYILPSGLIPASYLLMRKIGAMETTLITNN